MRERAHVAFLEDILGFGVVLDDGAVLATANPGDVFGEMALLTGEPRSASVSAVEPTHLFRLAQADFYSLLRERPQIIQAINRVLCNMVRRADAAQSERCRL